MAKTARGLGVSEKTLRRWEERGLIVARKLPIGARRFYWDDLKTGQSRQSRLDEGLPYLAEDDDIVEVNEATSID